MEPVKKHGIVIKEHKNWNTKTVYNNGYIMRQYRHQPKIINFKSQMVNDINQHLCGGWTFRDLGDGDKVLISQLLEKKKPFGCICYWEDKKEDAIIAQKRINAAGLKTILKERSFSEGKNIWDLLVCHDIKIKEIGNYDGLIADYDGIVDDEEIEEYGDLPLSSFVNKDKERSWDIPINELWLTGLILGYPIENTISLYWEHYKHLFY